MSLPSFPNELKHLNLDPVEPTVLCDEDEKYLSKLISSIRAGKPAIIVIEEEVENSQKLKYMFSNSSRAKAISMMGKVIEATGRRIEEDGGKC